VTFDFQCLRDAMARYTDLLDPQVITNIRLFGQVDFILNVIGVDGLNAAGATTAIETADCTDCNAPWCRLYDFTIEPFQFEPQLFGAQELSDYQLGVGFVTVYAPTGANGYTISAIAAPFAADIQSIEIGFSYTQGICAGSGDAALDVSSQGFANRFITVLTCDVPTSPDSWCYDSGDPAEPVTVTQLLVQLIAGVTLDDSDPGGSAVIQYLKIMGVGEPPPLGEVCEWEDCAT